MLPILPALFNQFVPQPFCCARLKFRIRKSEPRCGFGMSMFGDACGIGLFFQMEVCTLWNAYRPGVQQFHVLHFRDIYATDAFTFYFPFRYFGAIAPLVYKALPLWLVLYEVGMNDKMWGCFARVHIYMPFEVSFSSFVTFGHVTTLQMQVYAVHLVCIGA